MAALFELGVIADCQFGDKPSANGRSYRESLGRLVVAVDALNTKPLKAVLHLGDVIDGRDTHEASVEDLAAVLQTFGGLRHELLHAVGNHDLAVPRPQLAAALALTADTCYYSRPVPGTSWRLIVLDTVHVCNQWVDEGRQTVDPVADRWPAEHADQPNATVWNGMLGVEQRQWLDTTLSECDAAGERALVFGHNPLREHTRNPPLPVTPLALIRLCVQSPPRPTRRTVPGMDRRLLISLMNTSASLRISVATTTVAATRCPRPGCIIRQSRACNATRDPVLRVLRSLQCADSACVRRVQTPLDSNAFGVLTVHADKLVLNGFGTEVESREMLCRGVGGQTSGPAARL